MRIIKKGEWIGQVCQVPVRLDVVQLELHLAKALVEGVELEKERKPVVGSGTRTLMPAFSGGSFHDILIQEHRDMVGTLIVPVFRTVLHIGKIGHNPWLQRKLPVIPVEMPGRVGAGPIETAGKSSSCHQHGRT